MTDSSLDVQLDDVCQRLRAAVTRQHEERDPAHEDFYVWGWALTEVLDRVDQAVSVLERQVPRYGDRRVLRDDEDINPAARLVEVGGHLVNTRTDLARAREWIREYHSAVGHIAVAVDPTLDVDDDPWNEIQS